MRYYSNQTHLILLKNDLLIKLIIEQIQETLTLPFQSNFVVEGLVILREKKEIFLEISVLYLNIFIYFLFFFINY